MFTQNFTQEPPLDSSPYFMNMATAQAILLPRIPAFIDALRKATREWNDGLGAYHAILDEFARAVIISQFWYSHSHQLLRSDSGVSLERFGNRHFYTIERELVLRLKHVDSSYRSWNHPTTRALAWNAQASFPSIPPMVKLELGYRMDLTGTVVRDAMVMLNYKGHSLWRWQIWGRQISEFAAAARDGFGRLVYSHDDFSAVDLP